MINWNFGNWFLIFKREQKKINIFATSKIVKIEGGYFPIARLQ